jgi:tRNA(Ile)-lysidine synthase TilS/MesJ
MPLQLETSQGSINLPIENHKGISLSLSGGIDSATLLYIMSEYIYNNKLDTTIYAITVPNRTDSASAYHAALVINFIKKRFPINIEHIIKATTQDGGFKNEMVRRTETELMRIGKVTAVMTGLTANPKTSDFQFKEPDSYYIKPELHREEEKQIHKRVGDFDFYFPFANIDKRGVKEISDLKNISKRLLLITKSCTDNQKYVCGKCWWCQERAWAYDIEYTNTSRRKFRLNKNWFD